MSWGLGFVLAFMFGRLLALWVFMSTILTSTVFVPIMTGLFWPGRKKKLAGILAGAAGLAVAVAFYLLVRQCGVWNEEYETYIWRLSVGGGAIEIWQEYALLLSLPASFAGFLAGQALGRAVHDPDATVEVRA
jgi:hypothetical protein